MAVGGRDRAMGGRRPAQSVHRSIKTRWLFQGLLTGHGQGNKTETRLGVGWHQTSGAGSTREEREAVRPQSGAGKVRDQARGLAFPSFKSI